MGVLDDWPGAARYVERVREIEEERFAALLAEQMAPLVWRSPISALITLSIMNNFFRDVHG